MRYKKKFDRMQEEIPKKTKLSHPIFLYIIYITCTFIYFLFLIKILRFLCESTFPRLSFMQDDQ